MRAYWLSRSRRCQIALAMVLLLGLVGAAFYYRATVAAERRLQKAMAEADRLDPGWRLDDILRNQPAIPDEDNGALRRMTVERLLPAGLGSLFSSVASIRPQVQLSANLIASLRTKLQESSSAVEAARRLSQEKEGHIPITLGRNRYSTVLPPLMSSLDVARLLSLDATLLAQDQELDKAVDSCRAILGTGRTVGEGPYLMATLVRVSIALITQRSLERILAQGVTTEGDLADVQHFLEEEAGRPFLLNALRGERAGVDLMFEGLERAEIKVTDVVPLLQQGRLSGLLYAHDRNRQASAQGEDSPNPRAVTVNRRAALARAAVSMDNPCRPLATSGSGSHHFAYLCCRPGGGALPPGLWSLAGYLRGTGAAVPFPSAG